MGYEAALLRAWRDFKQQRRDNQAVVFLNDEYRVDFEKQRVLLKSSNSVAKDYISILILHYLKQQFEGLTALSNQWVTFAQLAGTVGYSPVFKRRVIDCLLRRFGADPEKILLAVKDKKAKQADCGDYSLIVDAFDRVPILVCLWKGDDELPPEANMLFDKSIQDILCIEDIVIVSEIVAHKL